MIHAMCCRPERKLMIDSIVVASEKIKLSHTSKDDSKNDSQASQGHVILAC